MGYTHYWDVHEQTLPQKQWDEFINDCKILLKNLPAHSLSSGGSYAEEPLYIGGCSGYQKPQFTKDHVYFNGSSVPASKRVKVKPPKGSDYWSDGQTERDLGHETFSLDRKQGKDNWNFCKTARKPYDLMVQAVLILAKAHFGDSFSYSSDGGDEEWVVAKQFVYELLPSVAVKNQL